MSGGVVRKVQPFTIGTRLSVPTEHKCCDIVDLYLPKSALSNSEQQSNLDEQHSAPASQSHTQTSCPDVTDVHDVAEQLNSQVLYDDETDEAEDRNSMSPTVSSRSIKKIAICSNTEAVPTTSSEYDTTGVLDKTTVKENSIHPLSQLVPGEEELVKRSNSHCKNPTQDGDHGQLDTDLREEMGQEELTLRGPTGEKTSEHLLRWLLNNYQQDVRLALDVSSFYQQADTIISNINKKSSVLTGSAKLRSKEIPDIQEIAFQIAMLEETALRLSDLHPTLAARVTQKQAEVQESWIILQNHSRNEKADYLNTPSAEGHAQLDAALQESTSSAAKTQSWLEDNVSMIAPTQQRVSVNCPETVSITQEEGEEVKSTRPGYRPCYDSTLTLKINQLLSRCAELSMDILDIETELVTRCDPANSDLEGLQEQQDKLEMEQEMMREDVQEVEVQIQKQSCGLQALSPEEVRSLKEARSTLQAWEELGWSLAENRSSLQQFKQLQHFLRTYLAMISWAEETRASIFSEVSMKKLRQAESTECSDLDLGIQEKFKDFDELVEAGQNIVKDRHHLADIIKERTEELQSMLGWIMVHWKAQKALLGQRKPALTQESDHQHKVAPTQPPPQVQPTPSPTQPQPQVQPTPSVSMEPLGSFRPEPTQVPSATQLQGPHEEPTEDTAFQGAKNSKLAFIVQRDPSDESTNSPSVVLEEPCTTVTPLGGSISVILTLDPQQPEGSQAQSPDEQPISPEPVHRVSTYLHVTDGNKESPDCKDGTLENTFATTQSNPPTMSTTATTFLPKVSTVLLPTSAATSSFSTLNVKPTAKKRKKAFHRHTVTGLAEVDCRGAAAPTTAVPHRANTWPLKTSEKISPTSPVNTELQLYIKNNSLVTRAEDEILATPNICTIQGDSMKSPGTIGDSEKTPYSIALGSTLSFDLPTNWEGISRITSKDLNIGRKPTDRAEDFVSTNGLSANLQRPPGQSDQAKIPSKVITKTLGVKAGSRSSEEDDRANPQDSVSNCVSILYPSPLEKDCNHCSQPEAGPASHQSSSFHIHGVSEQGEEEVSTQEGTLCVQRQSTEPAQCTQTAPENTCTKNVHTRHKCLSVHTKICDLKGHIYYSPKQQQPLARQTCLITQSVKGHSPAPVKLLGRGVGRAGRVVVCSEENCAVCSCALLAPRIAAGKETPHSQVSVKGLHPLHPDHWQFEEVEDELEDIWNAVDRERAP